MRTLERLALGHHQSHLARLVRAISLCFSSSVNESSEDNDSLRGASMVNRLTNDPQKSARRPDADRRILNSISK